MKLLVDKDRALSFLESPLRANIANTAGTLPGHFDSHELTRTQGIEAALFLRLQGVSKLQEGTH